MPLSSEHLRRSVGQAITHFWHARREQAERQRNAGRADQGARAAVTGGAQMDGFIALIADIAASAGAAVASVYRKKRLELPGFFRPTKEWDLLIVAEEQLIAVIEAKSQVGPSFGNNFNNRTEEAIGSALDLWTAYREGKFSPSPQPWLGYVFLLEDCPASRKPVKVREPHFTVFPEFKGASYAKRYELFCLKLVRERHYNAASFLMSRYEDGVKGIYSEPSPELSFESFAQAFQAHLAGHIR